MLLEGKKSWKNTGYIYLFFFLCVLLLHANMQMFQDDLGYLEKANRGILYSSAVHYITWSSRNFIELVMMITLKIGFGFWKIVDSLMWCVFVYSICSLFGDNMKRQDVLWACILALLMPISLLDGSTGWCATTTNYFWTTILGFYALIPIKKWWENETIPKWHLWVYRIALLYAANLELVCAVLSATLLICVVVFKYENKTMYKEIRGHFLFVVLELVYILTCPGNRARYVSEVGTWFPEYKDLNLLQKISMGAGATFYQLFYTRLSIVVAMCVLLGIYLYGKTELRKYLWTAVVPLAVCILQGTEWLPITNQESFQALQGGFRNGCVDDAYKFGAITAQNIRQWSAWVPMIFSVAIFLCLVVGMAICIKGKVWGTYIGAYLLIAGFGSRCIMAFTPTIWASALRTFIPFYCCLIVACFWVYRKIRNVAVTEIAYGIVLLMALVNVINYLMK